MSRIGIFGGTFSPPHNGHIRAAQSFISEVGLDRLLIMPANIPPHKEAPSAGADIRFEMCKIAFSSLDKVEISDIELKREGKSYTADTLSELSRDGDELFFLCGTDMFLSLENWYRPDVICSLATIVLSSRDGKNKREINRAARSLKKNLCAKVIILKSEPLEMSSTQIRDMIREGSDVSGMIPEALSDYIREKGLYSV